MELSARLSRRLRLALVSVPASPLAAPGHGTADGHNVHVEGLATALARRGHDVRVYTRRDDPDVPEVIQTAAGVRVVHVPAGPATALDRDELPSFLPDFGHRLAEEWTLGAAPDVVHAHGWASGAAVLAADKQRTAARTPLVVTFHAHGGPAGDGGLETLLGRVAEGVVARSENDLERLLRIGVPRSHIALIPSGVDTRQFRPGPDGVATRPLGRPARLLSVGGLSVPRAHLDAIRCLRALPGAELFIAGGPPRVALATDPYAADLRRAATANGVAGRVHLLGAVPRAQMPSLYRGVDVVVSAPAAQPFGLAALEAMACGTPVVAYAAGGLADSVVHGTTGLLVEPRDVVGLAGALRSLLDCEPLRYAYGVGAAQRAIARYPWIRIAEQIEAFYRRLLRAARRVAIASA